ncbi:ABC transporter permease [Listeria sp. PSOL-1]|uniref:ABC transporter permease n=1 Tax=Listeria sp. PSOL-1 TaxID=1844999 RepID=UPI0013D6084E|nr:ABC transporter permease [Listeria sp. PSOL-1]
MTAIFATIVSSTLLMAGPLIFTALGGVFSERGGIVNIGLEGMMVMGAFSAIVFNLTFQNVFGALTPWIALVAAMLVGGVFSLIHAVATINFRANHVISGVAINFLATGLSLFLVKVIYGKGQTSQISYYFGKPDISLFKDIPIIGEIFFRNVPVMSYVAILFAILAYVIIYKTRFGLRLRSVGEHPLAADTMGIKVRFMRYQGVIISGILGGLGGAVYAQSFTLDFSHATISGQGYMALAAMIFGKWNPLGAMGAAIFFGFAQCLAVTGGTLPFFKEIPDVYLQIVPYVLTILALVGFIGKSEAPKADGVNYIKGK